ncbi:hypothetical protein XELAEV_18020119mg [Xenopus laevis]|uniref:Uncharacterized protein n=1 Tax=Xenopus laevis TaxID=8355 RepID=A0A974HQD9_XENLA|nr:hypothetical protein XELAEV_18020119mg [Xenopus laevis]
MDVRLLGKAVLLGSRSGCTQLKLTLKQILELWECSYIVEVWLHADILPLLNSTTNPLLTVTDTMLSGATHVQGIIKL